MCAVCVCCALVSNTGMNLAMDQPHMQVLRVRAGLCACHALKPCSRMCVHIQNLCRYPRLCMCVCVWGSVSVSVSVPVSVYVFLSLSLSLSLSVFVCVCVCVNLLSCKGGGEGGGLIPHTHIVDILCGGYNSPVISG